jgi:biopolymer transport protein TolR
MAFSMSGNGSPVPQINITPLIDVLLVLIIVFMVVVSMSREKGLEAQIPQPAKDSTMPPAVGTVVVQVRWDGKSQTPRLKINEDDVSWNDLEPRLRDIFKQRAERVAFVKGDDDVDFEYIADVIDIARESGVERVGLMGKY